jgi:hypothetical protein
MPKEEPPPEGGSLTGAQRRQKAMTTEQVQQLSQAALDRFDGGS